MLRAAAGRAALVGLALGAALAAPAVSAMAAAADASQNAPNPPAMAAAPPGQSAPGGAADAPLPPPASLSRQPAKAWHLLRTGKYAEAADEFESSADERPWALIGSARCQEAVGRIAEAIERLERRVDAKQPPLDDADRAALDAELARLQLARGRHEQTARRAARGLAGSFLSRATTDLRLTFTTLDSRLPKSACLPSLAWRSKPLQGANE